MGIQGVVVAGIVCLLFGVFLPSLVRGRPATASAPLLPAHVARSRVVAVGGGATAGARRRGRCRGDVARSPRRKALLVSRPGDMRRASAADARSLAVSRARIAARRSRRAAGRRRRTLLNLTLLAITLVVLTLGLATGMSLAWTLPAAAVTGASLVASRRADVAAAVRDRQDLAELDAAEQRLDLALARHTTSRDGERRARAARDREDRTFAAVAAESPRTAEMPVVASSAVAAAPAAERRSGSSAVSASWTPTSVPTPMYAMKPAARRVVAAPYEAETPQEEADVRVPLRPTRPERVSAPLGSAAREHLAAPAQPPVEPIDLGAVLERRRRGA